MLVQFYHLHADVAALVPTKHYKSQHSLQQHQKKTNKHEYIHYLYIN